MAMAVQIELALTPFH